MSSKRLWELLSRKYNQELTADEHQELDLLLRRHQDIVEWNETFSRLREIEVKKLTSPGDEQRSRQAIAARLGLSKHPEHPENREDREDPAAPAPTPAPVSLPSRRPRPILLWVTVGCALITGLLWLKLPKTRSPTLPDRPSEIVTSTSKSKVQLPDGSTVILNRQSRLTYNKDFGVSRREISLTGEAYFDISRNKSVPLTVTAGSVKIRVIGTSFNVRAYTTDSTVETSLIRGSIEVCSADDPERTIRMRPNEKIIFGKDSLTAPAPTPEKHLSESKPKQVFVQMNRIKLNPTDSSINEIVWVQDKLVFKKEPFYSLAQKMERWYQVKLVFKDKISEQISLTGSLEKETLTEALDALQQLTPFTYHIDGDLVTISKKANPITN